MKLTDEDVREILRLIDESDLDELRIETGDFMLHVRKGGVPTSSPTPGSGGAAEPATPLPATTPQPPATTPQPPATTPQPPATTPQPQALPVPADGAITIDSPMLGTFYRAPDPGAKPFVDVGSEVEPDTIVCIIEVMKMMNSIPAGIAGTVVEVCPENAQLVEYGEPLFRVRASS
jgi:acetyl-CoA carboxylase biotin carboxyl carrier protein